MPTYIVKKQDGTFPPGSQPDGFVARGGGAMENRFFICDCPVPPTADFVVEFPKERQAQFLYYLYPNGKRLWWDPFDGAVQFSDDIDNKNRRAIMYSSAQLATQLEIMKWLSLNVWIPDKKRMLDMADEDVQLHINAVNAQIDSETHRTYIRKNLYYNL